LSLPLPLQVLRPLVKGRDQPPVLVSHSDRMIDQVMSDFDREAMGGEDDFIYFDIVRRFASRRGRLTIALRVASQAKLSRIPHMTTFCDPSDELPATQVMNCSHFSRINDKLQVRAPLVGVTYSRCRAEELAETLALD
jgi:hypothetical protein